MSVNKELDEALKPEEIETALDGGCSCHGYECHCDSLHLSTMRTAYRSSLSTIRAQEEEIAGLKKAKDCCNRGNKEQSHAPGCCAQTLYESEWRKVLAELRRANKLIEVLKKTPYTLHETNGKETLAAWEEYNGRFQGETR